MKSVRKLDLGLASAPDYTKKKEFSDDRRKELAKSGAAMSDGSFPITDSKDVHDAVDDWGRAGSREDVKAHIIERAKALGAEGSLPDDWTAKKSASPVNPMESNPDNTDTMEEDPTVDSLKVPTAYFDIMNQRRQGKVTKPERQEGTKNPDGIGPISKVPVSTAIDD